jgi:hypothetical protein
VQERKGKRTLDISISEVTQFLRCRRQWDISSPNRQALRRIALPRAVLNIGTLVHAALAAHSQGKDPYDALTAEYMKEQDRFFVAYQQAVGVAPDQSELDGFIEQAEQAMMVVRRYFGKYGTDNPLGEKYTVKAAEQTFRIAIPGTDGHFIGTLDRLIERTDGAWFVGEIKTFDRRPEYDSLMLRPQFTAYTWAANVLFGSPVQGVLYDGVSRRLPRPPETLKRGGLSKAWSDSLDYLSYVQAASAQGGGNLSPYEDILQRLYERDSGPDNPYYMRRIIPITPGQIVSFVDQLRDVYNDIAAGPKVYPNFQTTCTWDCHVRDLCSAMQHREDVDSLIQLGYTQNQGSQSFQQRHGAEETVDADYFTSL